MIVGKGVNKFYKRYWWAFILGIAVLLVVDYCQLIIPDIIQALTDDFDAGVMTISKLGTYALRIIIIAIIVFVGRFTWRHFIFGTSRKIERDLREDLFKHCEDLSSDFYSRNKTGGLLAYYTNDIESIRRAFASGVVQVVDCLFMGTLSMYKMVNLNSTLAIIAIVPMFIVSMIGVFAGKSFENTWDRRQKAYEKVSDFVTENFYGISVIKAFVKQKEEYKEFKNLNKENYNANVKVAKLNAGINTVIEGVISIIFVLIMIYGAFLISKGTSLFTVGMLMGFIYLFDNLIWPLLCIPQIIITHSQAKASLKRYETIMNEKVDVKDDENTDSAIDKVSGDIVFKDLNFAYDDGEDLVLKDINLRIEDGKTVGIIGRTGCGKTTLVELLLRLYNTNKGELFIGDKDIRTIPIHVLREAFAYVPQDGFLFSDNIINNIGLGLPTKKENTLDLVVEAAKCSAVHDNIINFPDQYNTIVGERGVTLSGGQKQRVSIARALVKDAKYLILDDSVSAVDTSTEETILQNLKNIRNNKTTIIIAHRISTIKDADYICVMDKGQIRNIGTHEELLKKSALYKDIVQRQRLDDLTGGGESNE